MDESNEEPRDESNEEPRRIEPVQWRLAVLMAAFMLAAIFYKVLRHENLGHSALLFIGIPAMLAIPLSLSPKAKTATGAILKGITLALLLLAPLLGEGFICIIMAAPIFYVVGIAVGIAMDRYRNRRRAALSCVTLFLLPMCLEGVIPQLTFERAQTAEATKILNLPADAVELALAQTMRVNTPLPEFLQIGFPRPLAAWGQGLAVGDTRTVHFSGAEGHPPGDLVLRVAESRTGYVRFDTLSDGSKLAQWVRWISSEVEWKAVDRNHTMISWRIHFERQLDPAWYFGPLEWAAVQQAAGYLIHANIDSAGSTE